MILGRLTCLGPGATFGHRRPGPGRASELSASQWLASRSVDAAELAPFCYRDVSLDFRLPAPAVLEFPGGDVVDFAQLTVTPVP